MDDKPGFLHIVVERSSKVWDGKAEKNKAKDEPQLLVRGLRRTGCGSGKGLEVSGQEGRRNAAPDRYCVCLSNEVTFSLKFKSIKE